METVAPSVVREYRPAWAVHAALRFAASPYTVDPLCVPEGSGELRVDAIGAPVLVDGSAIAHGTARCLELIESRAPSARGLVARADLSAGDRSALEALLALCLSTLEAVAVYIEFVENPERSEAPERALTPIGVRWLVRRERTSQAASTIDNAGIASVEDARAVAIRAYQALGNVLSDAEEGSGPFFFGSR
jgi:hypothetical protein